MKLDINILTENLKSMAGTTCKAEIDLRPFYQGIPFIAKLQMEYGAVGSSISKVEDIEELAQYGIFDFLMTKPLEDYSKIIELSLQYRILIVIDETTNIPSLVEECKKHHQCIEVIVNYDFSKDHQKYLTFIQSILAYDELDFAGIQAYDASLAKVKDYYERYDKSYDIEEDLTKLINLFKENDIQVDIVTGLSTATTHFREEKYFDTVFTESQAGNYSINTKYLKYKDVLFENALFKDEDPTIYLVDGDEIIDTL